MKSLLYKYLDLYCGDIKMTTSSTNTKVVFHGDNGVYFVLYNSYIVVNDKITDELEDFFSLDWIMAENSTKEWFCNKFNLNVHKFHIMQSFTLRNSSLNDYIE